MASFKNLISNTSAQISSGGTITGDLVINGDLQVDGGGSLSFDEIVSGTSTITVTDNPAFLVEKADGTDVFIVDTTNSKVSITDTLNLNPTISSGSKTSLAFQRSGANKWRFIQPHDDSYLKLYNDSASATQVYFKSDNKVGFGTNAPEERIHSTGAIVSTGVNDTGATAGTERAFIDLVSNKARIGHFRGTTSAGSGGLQFYTDSVERARIDASGNLGIGTTATANRPISVKVNRNGTQELKFENDDSGEWYFTLQNDRMTEDSVSHAINFDANDSGGTNTRYSKIENVIVDSSSGTEDGKLVFSTFVNGTSTETMHITNSSVGIGTGSDTIDAPLHVKGGTANTAKFQSSSGATNTLYTDSSDSLVGQIEFGASASQIVTRTSSTLSLGSNNVQTLHITDDDRVGIGTESPSKKLEVAGDIKLLNGTNNITVFYGGDNWGQRVIYNTGNMDFFLNGENRFVIDTNSRISLSNNDGGADNTVFGKLAGNALTTNGDENVLIGHEAGNDVSTGERNVFIGYQSGDKITSGTRSVAIGYGSLGSEQAGERSIAIGFNALSQQNVGANTYNTAVGVEAGFYNRTGTKNTFLGYNAGLGASEQSNSNNTAVGYSSMIDVTTGSDNVAVGIQSLQNLTSGSRNVALGYFAMAQSIDTNDTVAIGRYAMGAGDVANDGQIAIGRNALAELTSGSENIAVGYLSGDTITTGTKNTCIGYNTDVSDAGAINRTGLGNGITLGANNSVVLGNNDVTDIYMAQDGGARIHCSQIQFPASQDASSDPNRLDDYEEGYHDIAVTGSSSGSMTFNTSFNQLSYTKIGRQVHVTGEVRVASDNSISGDLRFTLPFALADLNQNSGYAVGNVHLSGHGDASIDDNKTFLYATDGNQYFQIAHVADDDTFTFINNSHVDTAFNITVSITYFSA
jgi:hypothetical protein